MTSKLVQQPCPEDDSTTDEYEQQRSSIEKELRNVGFVSEPTMDNDTDEPETLPQSSLPVVAIIGRPNVGKSMLVNRLTRQFNSGSVVDDIVGITRDRSYLFTDWAGYKFQMVDTGGLVFDDNSIFMPEIRAQAMLALEEASVAILVVDGQAGVNPLDQDLVDFLHRECSGLPIVLAVNKCESSIAFYGAAEFWSLRMGEPFAVSAIHGRGTGELLDEVVKHIPMVTGNIDESMCNVAIVGRPNVGKSSLLNVLSRKDRAIVSDVPGTTRDAIDEVIQVNDKSYRLIDTAGIRRKTNVKFGTEFFMINRAFKAIRRADVVLLIVDMEEGASEQDRKIAERIAAEGKACVILGNKWDLITEKDNRSYRNHVDKVRETLGCITWAEAELVSALSKQRTQKIFEYVDRAYEQSRRRVSTAVLNEVLRDAIDFHKPPAGKHARQGRVYYCTQVASRPPTIALFVNSPQLFREGYRRYLERRFRESLGFKGTPIRIVWRGKARAPVL